MVETKEFAELRNKLDVWRNEANNIIAKQRTSFQDQLNELKDKVESLKDVEQSRDNIKEVLRKLGYDYVKHMKEEHSYIVPLNVEKALEKLDGVGSARQTEKKEDTPIKCSFPECKTDVCGWEGLLEDCPKYIYENTPKVSGKVSVLNVTNKKEVD